MQISSSYWSAGLFFGTRREYCASEEESVCFGTAFREEEEKMNLIITMFNIHLFKEH